MRTASGSSHPPSFPDLAVSLAGYLFLLATTIVQLNGSALVAGDDGFELIQQHLWTGTAVLFGLHLVGAATVLGLYGGRRWGWFGAGAVFGIWGIVTALLDRPLTTVLAVGLAVYHLALGGTINSAT